MKVHYTVHPPFTLCGVALALPKFTNDPAQVTCKICIRALQKG